MKISNISYGFLLILLMLISCEEDSEQSSNKVEELQITYIIHSITSVNTNDGSIDITVTGGVSPYDYVWSTGATSEDLDNIGMGNYIVQVTDKTGDLIEKSIHVDEDNLVYRPLSAGYEISLITSLRDHDGSIKMLPDGGKEPYSYRWSTGDTLNTIDNLTIGEYAVTITDMLNQTAEKNISLDDGLLIYKEPINADDGWSVSHIYDYVKNKEYLIDALKRFRIDHEKIHSMLISVDNKLILEEYYPGLDSQGNYHDYNRFTPHEVQSASKSYRSALIGIAIHNGFIQNKDVPIIDLLPNYSNLIINGKENILLKHVLSMSSGLEWNEWYGTPNSLYEMYELPYDQWFSYVLSKPLENTPGTYWEYHSGASMMLNEMVSNAIDTDINTFVKQYFADQIESTYSQGFGNPIGVNSVPRDMLKLGQIYLNDGKWKENQIISKEWVDKSFERLFYVSENNAYYGYQWWSRDLTTNQGTYECNYAWGNGGQYIMVIKELNLVAVFTGEAFNTFAPKPFEIMENYVIPAME
jgi:CubicO group peptidase (beta-lactamase class C family)